eukprot:6988559-Pyramimonas_sp.AAC.1
MDGWRPPAGAASRNLGRGPRSAGRSGPRGWRRERPCSNQAAARCLNLSHGRRLDGRLGLTAR